MPEGGHLIEIIFHSHITISVNHDNCRLHLVDTVGKISLAEVTLTEDPSEEERIDEGKQASRSQFCAWDPNVEAKL